MLMRGDLNRIIEQVNGVTEGRAKRVKALEEQLEALTAPVEEAPKPRGRPKGSKNKPKEEKAA